MPSKPKPSDIATEAKKIYIPEIKKSCPEWTAQSYIIDDSAAQLISAPPSDPLRCRVAIIEGDPVDVAISWATTSGKEGRIPVINMANDKRPGGDWEASVLAPEENLCRRSNLYMQLANAINLYGGGYPLQPRGAVYSEQVVVFRDGPERWQPWREYKVIPVISVPPVRRPKTDASGKKYSFDAEKDMMRDKIRTALRVAIHYRHTDICLGAYGCGPIFRNPTKEVAKMFRDALFYEDEFRGQFDNVVFAFETNPPGSPSSSSSSSTNARKDIDVFKEVFDPIKIHKHKKL